MKILRELFLIICLFFFCISSMASPPIRIGSKKFTESVILAELAAQLMSSKGAAVTHRAELGGTRILWNALLGADIDAYPEYTGTLRQEILPNEIVATDQELRQALKKQGILMSAPLGFNNTYALGIKKTDAQRLGIKKISDLKKYPQLKFGFSNEFHQRADGWLLVKNRYHLDPSEVRGLDHDIAYAALNHGDIDLVDLYSTDAEIQYYDLFILEDDLRVFPQYEAVFLYRADLLQKDSQTVQAILELKRLEGSLSASQMIELNAEAKIKRLPESKVAAAFSLSHFGVRAPDKTRSMAQEMRLRLGEHLRLVVVSMMAAVFVAIPLGIAASASAFWGRIILSLVGLIQTIPALALLVMLLRPLKALGLPGIGDLPAVVALFLYSLLPIVRNTYAGLRNIPLEIHESAEALGLSYFHRLKLIELPLASPLIFAGIKTSAVINIGFATLGALVGAGGFGQPILAGIRLDDSKLILQGAIPAALLAIAADFLFDQLSRRVIPKGLRR